MATLTIRNVPDHVHKALKRRAVEHDNSTEEEVRVILASAVKPPTRLVDMLLAAGRQLEGVEVDFDVDKRPYETKALS
jgi:antitoxin FitA